jgi:predicted DsbA family dithiol-disulfide isomerase
MPPGQLEIYSSMECPYAYLATYRLRQLRNEFAGRVQIVWRALSLEYINRGSYPKPLRDAEQGLFATIEPQLPFHPWARPDWEWPATFWPAFEALACAQAQDAGAAFELSWALRHAYFAESRSPSLRHEILAIAEQVASIAELDLARFERDWDTGRYKGSVIAESRRGWHALKVNGSATLVLPDGSQVTNPAIGEIDFDEQRAILRSYTPYPADPLDAYREIFVVDPKVWTLFKPRRGGLLGPVEFEQAPKRARTLPGLHNQARNGSACGCTPLQ